MSELMERQKKVVAVIKAKQGLISKLVFIALVAIAVIAVQRAWKFGDLKKECNKLQNTIATQASKLEELDRTKEQLEYSEGQVKLLKESTNALKEQVSGLNAEKEDLNNKLEELLKVNQTVPVITRELLDEQVTSLSELVTKKYFYRNATKSEEAKEWLWGATMPFSDIKFVAMYDGTITAGIDLKEVKFDVNQHSKTITVTMPKSKIFDHNCSATRFLRNADKINKKNCPRSKKYFRARSLAPTAPHEGDRPEQEGGLFKAPGGSGFCRPSLAF